MSDAQKSDLTLAKLMSFASIMDSKEIPLDTKKVTRDFMRNVGIPRKFVYSEAQLKALKRTMLEQCCRALYRHHRTLSKFLRKEYLS